MAGSVTATVTNHGRGVTKTSLAWVSDAAGAVSDNSVTLGSGTVVVVVFTPDSGGTQPTDLYDVTMTCDSHPAVNVLDDGGGTSVGANLSNANASHKVPMIGGGSVTYVRQWLHAGGYTLVVANAGNAKGGTVDIYTVAGVLP